MNKIITAGCVAVAAFAAVAMPNKRELADAKPHVEDVTKADLAAFKAGKKPAKDVADAHISLAEKAENQAEKYLLYQGAFKLYARCEEYDLAADAIDAMNRNVKDIPPEVIAEIVGDELRYVPDGKAPQLVAMLKETKAGKPTAGDADEKLYLDVVAELRRKGGSGKERANIVLSRLFPGWTVTAGERIGDMGGFTASHRGKNNVFCSHPISQELPMILSREVKLSVKNPCLLLTVSSFDQKSDCLLSVRVNGKDALPARRINTPDNAPWEDVVVPLSAWSGQTVKVEIVNNANNWWCEHLFLSRIEIAENARYAKPQNVKVLGNTQRRVAKLFPGWSLDTPVAHEAMNDENSADFLSSHRGLDNVMCVHPLNETTPAVLSRTVMLSSKNPCLFLKVSSWAKNIQGGDCDFLLSVRVNGKEALTKRRICTPDSAPWEDVIVPLSDWRGKNVKIEVILIANGWWHEFPILARLEVGEGNGEYKATIDGYTWSYRVNNGEAEIVSEKDGSFSCAVSPRPKGNFAIPLTLSGVKVKRVGKRAFEGCGEIASVTIPNGVKSIGDYAFKECRGMSAVTIPPSVTDIGREAFNCWSSGKGLQSVTIPQGVTVIRNSTFTGTALTNVIIPASVKTLERGAFSWCGELKSVTLPEGMTSIGRDAFYNCGKLESLTIPSSVQRIEQGAFHGCGSLTSLTIPSTVANIDRTAFDGCSKLSEIHVPANAKSWAGMKEWQGKKLVFDEKIDTSGFDHEEDPQEAARKAVATLFPGWSLDTEIAPNPRGGFCDSHRGESNVMYIHPKAEGASAIVSRTMKLSDKNPCLFLKTASWSEDNMDFILSVRVNGKEVMPKRRICTPDFEPWKELTIPLFAWRGRVVKVEVVLTANGWWYEFPFFKRIEIAEGTGEEKFVAEAKETIGGYTWSYRVDNGEATIISEKNGDCSCAVSPEPKGPVSIPSTLGGFRVTSIGTSAFLRCKELKSVVIPTGVTSIGWCAFYGCGGLDSVTIPDGVIGIERGAFAWCHGLSSAALPPSVTDIGIEAFEGCGALTSITIPGGVKVIKGGSFSGCCGLTSLTIPMGVEVIKSGAFSWYCGFKTVSISASVTNIEQGAFIDCKQIESFHVDAANPAYCSKDGLLCSKDGSRLIAGVNGDVTIPEGVKDIGVNAFHGCSGLRTVTIPSSVTNIGYWAFSFLPELISVRVDEANCFYKSVNGLLLTKDGSTLVRGKNGDVTIPAGVKTIGDSAFSCCKLNSVTIPEGAENIKNAFFGCRGIQRITIPSTVKDISIKAFQECGDLMSVTMCGERPGSGKDVFRGCNKLTAIHVPANAKSWAGMKEWQGKKLVFDEKGQASVFNLP